MGHAARQFSAHPLKIEIGFRMFTMEHKNNKVHRKVQLEIARDEKKHERHAGLIKDRRSERHPWGPVVAHLDNYPIPQVSSGSDYS